MSAQNAEPKVAMLQAVHEVVLQFAQNAMFISLEQARDLVNEVERTASAMPVLDPGGYRAIAHTLPEHQRLVRAFYAFRQELEAITEESSS